MRFDFITGTVFATITLDGSEIIDEDLIVRTGITVDGVDCVAEPLEEIQITKKLVVKNTEIIEATNIATARAVYTEDEGLEFKQLRDADEIIIRRIFKNSMGEAVRLILESRVRVGGFGWHSGYQRGYQNCTTTINKVEGKWSSAWEHVSSECDEVEFDYYD